jgi:hypothetical protein
VHETVGLASTEIPHNPVEDVTASAPEMPSVDAAPGHGYEYMAKQLWREMHNSAKHFKLPDHTDPKSDLVQLFNADDKSIDGVVHRIAMDPQHGFFHADGTNTNVLISPHEHMTIGADGNIHMGEGNIDYGVQAPEGAHTTPVYHPEAPAGAPHENLMPEPEKVFGPAGGPHAPPVEAPVVHTVNYPPPAEHPAPPEVPVSRVEPPPPDSPPAPPIESHAPSVASHAPVESAGHEILNKFNIPVSIDHSHIYADPVAPEKMFVYGGSPAEQAKMITEYLTKDNYGVIYSADASGVHRVAWFLHYPDMKIAQSSPVRTNGLRALFSPFMKPPRPDEFGKIIK